MRLWFTCLAGLFTLMTLSTGAETAAQDISACGFNQQAIALATLIQHDPGQQRQRIQCHPLLAQAAEDKARIMADYGMVRHNLGGSPNTRLRDIGFPLPRYYSGLMGNQVEAVAGGYRTPASVWKAFKSSEDHRLHLLGELDFYREQEYMGVGFFSDPQSPHIEYWVVYLTKAADEDPVPDFEFIPNKGVFVVQQVEPQPVIQSPK
ncbi:MAG: CAP domain-containing protein [Pseudomonadota bacterium]|nr:CAP domain-containing protein [Pseudomonadota bacterium]